MDMIFDFLWTRPCNFSRFILHRQL